MSGRNHASPGQKKCGGLALMNAKRQKNNPCALNVRQGLSSVENAELFIKQNRRFSFENGGFVVAEAGLEPAASGL